MNWPAHLSRCAGRFRNFSLQQRESSNVNRKQSVRLYLLGTFFASTLTLYAANAAAIDLVADPWGCIGTCGVGINALDPTGPGVIDVPTSTYGFVTTNGSTATASLGKGDESNGSRVLSSSFSAVKDETLSFSFNYVTTDSKEFTDYGWARVINTADNSTAAWLFAARSSSQNSSVVPGGLIDSNYFSNNADGVKLTPAFNSEKDGPVWAPLGGSSGTCFETKKECGYSGWLDSSITFAKSGTYALEFGVTNVTDGFFNSGLAFRFDNVDKMQLDSIASQAPEPSTFVLMGSALILLGWHSNRRRRSIDAREGCKTA
jgi:PEP-CTERM motif